MSKISESCVSEALTALKHFSKEELESYAREVFNRAREYGDVKNMKAFERAMQEINNEKAKSYFEDATIKANNILKFERNAKQIREGKIDVRGLLASRSKKVDGKHTKLSVNVSIAQKHELEKMIQQVLGDMPHDEVEMWSSGKLDQSIVDIFDGKDIDNPVANKIAAKLKDYFPYRNSNLVVSNAMRFEEINEDRLFRAVHDAERIINGNKSLAKVAKDRITKKYDISKNKIAWREFIKQHLDLEETFKHTPAMDLEGNLIDHEVDKILNRIFDNITTGKSEIFTRSQVANDREAVQKKSRMFFKWKDLGSLYEYNKQYGKGNLFHMFMADAKATSNKVGLAKMWGDNPYSMYNDLRKVQDESSESKHGGTWWHYTDLYFKEVAGIDKASLAPTATNFFSNLKTISSMARLARITLLSVPDIATISSFAQRMGINYSRAYLNQLSHIFDTFSNEERTHIAKMMKTEVDSHLGYMGRWGDQTNVSSLINKVSTRYFKYNLLESFDRGNKISLMHSMAKHVGENSNKSFDRLYPQLQKWVSKFMNKDEWELLRTKTKDGIFSTENADRLTNEEIKGHFDRSDKLLPMGEMRDDLNRKIYSMFSVTAENAVLSPTEFENVYLMQGARRGTKLGEALSLFTQFKTYTLSFIDRVLVQGWRDSDTSSQKLKWGLSMLVGTLPLSVLSTYLDNIIMGKSSNFFEMWDSQNVPERTKMLFELMAPSLSLFAGFLDPSNQNSNLITSFLSSPSTRLIGNALSAPLALLEGNTKKAEKSLINALNYLTPINTTPVITPLLQQAMGEEARLEPGQHKFIGN